MALPRRRGSFIVAEIHIYSGVCLAGPRESPLGEEKFKMRCSCLFFYFAVVAILVYLYVFPYVLHYSNYLWYILWRSNIREFSFKIAAKRWRSIGGPIFALIDNRTDSRPFAKDSSKDRKYRNTLFSRFCGLKYQKKAEGLARLLIPQPPFHSHLNWISLASDDWIRSRITYLVLHESQNDFVPRTVDQ